MAIKLTAPQRKKLKANWKALTDESEDDVMPVAKLFVTVGAARWLLVAMDPNDETVVEGICDLGSGFVEYGSIDLAKLAEFRDAFDLGVQVDKFWKPKARVEAYLEDGIETGKLNCDLVEPGFGDQ